MSLEDLERKVYNQGTKEHDTRPSLLREKKLEEEKKIEPEIQKESEQKIPDVWGDLSSVPKIKEEKKTHKSWAKWVVICLGILFIGGVAYAIIFPNVLYKNTTPNISVGITAPDSVYVGTKFQVKVSVGNIGGAVLKNVSLNILPDSGIECRTKLENDTPLSIETIPSMEADELQERTFECIPIGDVRTVHQIKALASYSEFSGTVNEEFTKDVFIKNYGIELRAKNLENVVSGVPTTLEFSYSNISGTAFQNVRAELQYPSTFELSSSTVSLENGKRFIVGEIIPAKSENLSFMGTFTQNKKINAVIPLIFKEVIGTHEYEIARTPISVGVIQSPIEITIFPKNGSTIGTKDYGQYEIKFKNTSGVSLADVVLRATLDGDMFDFNSVRGKATIDATGKTLVWTTANESSLKLLKDGDEGRVSFSIQTKENFPITNVDDINFVLRMNVEATSPTVPSYVKGQKTEVKSEHMLKVSGKHIFESDVYFNDASAKLSVYGTTNKGTFPLKVGVTNEYSLHIRVRSLGTGMQNGIILAKLAPGVTCGTFIKSNASTSPVCNSRTQEITWNFGDIAGNAGVAGIDPIEAVLQIQATPGIDLKGKDQQLISNMSYTGTDAFTGENLSGTIPNLTTYNIKDISDNRKKMVSE